MKFSELESRNKNHINGRLASFVDRYIRQNRVWTPEQMFSTFFEMIDAEIKEENFSCDFRGDAIIWSAKKATLWLNNEEGKKFALEIFQKKYLKDKFVADKKSPLVERIRFGTFWNKQEYFDIGFGLRDRYNFIKTEELKKLSVEPWTIKHVNEELNKKYNTDLWQCLNKLSTSHLEKLFFQKWAENHYFDDSPALIPEICGLRSRFFYYELGEEISNRYSSRDQKTVNFRYDFLVSNFKKQKIAFIELDGFEYHKSRKQQTIDSIKRNNAALYGISLLTFTSKRILEDIDSVFDELENYVV